MKGILSSKSIVSCLILFLIQPGCATTHKAPIPEERAPFGTIGVVQASYLPETEFDVPAKGRPAGALKGAGIAIAAVLEGGMRGMGGMGGNETGAAIYMLALVGLAMATAPVGAVVGAVKAMPGKEAAASEALTEKVLERMRTQEVMRNEVLQAGIEKTGRRLVPVDGVGPSAADTTAIYESLAGKGIDTVLEVALRRIALESEQWGSDPPLKLAMRARCRVVRVGDGTQVDDEEYFFLSVPRKLSEWTADTAALLGRAYEEGYQRLAADIIQRVFMATPLRGTDNAVTSPAMTQQGGEGGDSPFSEQGEQRRGP